LRNHATSVFYALNTRDCTKKAAKTRNIIDRIVCTLPP
jgi:hypothetical protein